MESLYASRSKDFIKNFNFVGELMADFEEAVRKLSNVHEGYLEVLSQVWIFMLIHKSCDHELDDSWFILSVDFVDDLFLAIKMDGATHDNKRGVEGILELVGVQLVKEVAGALDD